MQKTYLVSLAALLLLSGCAITPQPVAGPDGKNAYFMKCGAGADAPFRCMSKAAEICPGGYEILGNNSQIVPSQWGAVSMQSMTVACK